MKAMETRPKKGRVFYGEGGQKVVPSDPEIVNLQQRDQASMMKDLRRRLTKAEAARTNMQQKMQRLNKENAIKEIEYERKLESLQKEIVELKEDDFGMQALKLEKMLKKHAKMDFMDKVKVKPDYQLKKDVPSKVTFEQDEDEASMLRSDSDSDSQSESADGDSDEMQSRNAAAKSRAERKLQRLLMQSIEDPFQRDMLDFLPPEARDIYENPDILVEGVDRADQMQLMQKNFLRNQRIAISDFLKQKKFDNTEYKVKYQARYLQELLDVNKAVEKERNEKRREYMRMIADRTANQKVADLKYGFAQHQQDARRRAIEEQLLRVKNKSTAQRLADVAKMSEQKEMQTFALRDRKLELKHELQINKDIDSEIHEYLKSELIKAKKLKKQHRELKEQVEEGRAQLE